MGIRFVTNEVKNSQGTVVLGLGTQRLYIGTHADPSQADMYMNMDVASGTFKMKNITVVSSGGEAPLGVFRGAYAAVQYYTGDEVTYQGSTYRCILNSIGNAPTNTTYWTVVAQKGTDGTSVKIVGAVATSTDLP